MYQLQLADFTYTQCVNDFAYKHTVELQQKVKIRQVSCDILKSPPVFLFFHLIDNGDLR